MKCRFCAKEVSAEFADLVNSPPSNSYLKPSQLNEPEVYYPLRVMVCESCLLVQIDEYKKSADIFNEEYAYFSSYSVSWLKHAENYVNMMVDRFRFSSDSLVMEIASNDGYLLQYFHKKGIPVLGIEPTANTAAAAREKGIPSVVDFFSTRLATHLRAEGRKADLLLGNNVLAHVPDINDFVGGMPHVLKENGVITMEFPHLYQLVLNNQFDTIYHEHFSYLSFTTVKAIFESHQLRMFDVQEVPTHGGSLRIFACHQNSAEHPTQPSVDQLLLKEKEAGMLKMEYYTGFQEKVNKVKNDFLNFVVSARKQGKKIAGYGAAAKGNTLLNYCGIRKDLISFVADANPHKQGKHMPGSHIPIYSESEIRTKKPDYVVIFPWNLREEIVSQLSYIREWKGEFVVPVPSLEIIP